MRRLTRTKIISTLGPASSRPAVIRRLFEAGVDTFRFNFSHGTHDEHLARLQIVRELEQDTGRPIGVLADMQGPKLRVGHFANPPVELRKGARLRLDLSDEPGDARRVQLPHPEIFAAIKPGAFLLLDDGKLKLQVVDCGEDYADTDVVVGGLLSDHKGVNLPNVSLDISPLTEKDRSDLAFALDHGIDCIALSFVQRPEDITEARQLIDGRAQLLAKLEKPSAIQHLDKIVSLADAVMVARGDLGVELPTEDVPVLQRRIIRACRRAGRPVVVATQMLELMLHSPTPTRAEASDVAAAVYEGADAVMLSGETAAGDYPIEAVTIMERIIARAEQDPAYRALLHAERMMHRADDADAITAAASDAATTVGAQCIVTWTLSGDTTLRASRERPLAPILAITPTEGIARNLTFCWGVHPVVVDRPATFREMIGDAEKLALSEGFAEVGGRMVFVAGFPAGSAVNTLRVSEISAPT